MVLLNGFAGPNLARKRCVAVPQRRVRALRSNGIGTIPAEWHRTLTDSEVSCTHGIG
jgi:hypothetical protein